MTNWFQKCPSCKELHQYRLQAIFYTKSYMYKIILPHKSTVNPEIFAKSIKRHICHVKKSRLGHDLPTSVNDRVINFTILRGFYFHETSHPRKISILQYFGIHQIYVA